MKLAHSLMLSSMLVTGIVAGPALAQESHYGYCKLLEVPDPKAPPAAAAAPATAASPGAAAPASAPAVAPAPAAAPNPNGAPAIGVPAPGATPLVTSTPAPAVPGTPGSAPVAPAPAPVAPAATPAATPAAPSVQPGTDKAGDKAGDKGAADKADKPIPKIEDLIKANLPARDIVNQILTGAAPTSPADLEKLYDGIYNEIARTYIEPANLMTVNLPAYRNKYKGKIKTWADLNDAIQDVVKAVSDRWTWYQDPATGLANELGGNKSVDFGASFRLMKDGSFTIEHLEPGSTAQAGGLREGDTVISINNVPLKGMTKVDAEKLGVKTDGDQLHVKSIQDGQVVEMDYTLHAPPADAEAPKIEIVEGNLVYMKLPSFMNEKVFNDLMNNLLEADVKVGGGIQGIILDLRYNGGGMVEMAKNLIAALTNEGVVLHERKRNDRFVTDEATSLIPMPLIMRGRYNAPQLAIFNDLKQLPLVILINGSSASASEIVTGALQESRPNTTVMGERSFGKFVEMSVRPLPTCGTMAITSAMYTTPNGNWFHGVGIKPDRVIHQTRGSKDDAQLEAAVSFLQKKTDLNGANIAKLSNDDTKILGTVAEKPLEPRVSTWHQWLEVNFYQVLTGCGALLFMLIGLGYWFVSRPEKEN